MPNYAQMKPSTFSVGADAPASETPKKEWSMGRRVIYGGVGVLMVAGVVIASRKQKKMDRQLSLKTQDLEDQAHYLLKSKARRGR